MTYLIKATNVYRVPTVQDALDLRKELEQSAGELTSFKYTTKQIKAKGEVIEEYQQVTATLTFDNEKEPVGGVREYYGGLGEDER